MKRQWPIGAGFALTAALAAVLLWPRDSSAAVAVVNDFDFGSDEPDSSANPLDANYLGAFLRLIRFAEHDDSDVYSNRDYSTFYGGSLFHDFSDHPVITGEKSPIALPVKYGGKTTSAAGAYQIIKPTWERVRRAGSWGARLDDFSPASQDEAARRLLIERGALDVIQAGDVERAIELAAPVWASLPGSRSGQPQITLTAAVSIFNNNLWA